MTEAINEAVLSEIHTEEQRDQLAYQENIANNEAGFFQRNLRRLEVGSAAVLSAMTFATADGLAIANQSRPTARIAQAAPTPGSIMHGVNVFYERTIASWGSVASAGGMNNIQHMDVRSHSYVLSAVCHIVSKYGSNYNDVSFVRNNLNGDYEVTCQNGDQGVERSTTPIGQECTNTRFYNCKDMNLVPAIQEQGNYVASYLKGRFGKKLVNVNFGNARRLHVDNYKGQNKSDAEVYYAKNSSVTGRKVKEVIVERHKQNQMYKVELYPKGTITLK